MWDYAAVACRNRAGKRLSAFFLLPCSLLFGYQEAFVESKACQPCHAETYRSYMQTAMANSSGAVGSGPTVERFSNAQFLHERSGVRYSVRNAENTITLNYEHTG